MTKVGTEPHGVEPGNAQHIGSRSEQQDAFGFSAFDDLNFVAHAGILAIVADGMGGLALGKDSSVTAVHTFLATYTDKSPDEKIAAILDRSLHSANRAVNRKAAEAGVEGEAGTTLVAVVIHENLLYRIGVGDSRIYLFRDGKLKQLTTDYNYGRVLDRMVEKGEMSETEAAAHPSRAALTSYLGKAELDEYDQPSDPTIELQPGDKVLLSSDGLFGFLPEDEIACLMSLAPQQAAEAMVQTTIDKKNPYQDNVTVAILGYKLPPASDLTDTRVRISDSDPTIEAKPADRNPTGKSVKVIVLLIILAVAGFWGGKYFF
jgi:protein phosphatase